MKTAFVYSGQGAQIVGMGQDLYEQHEIVRNTFETASAVVGYDMAEMCFEKESLLNETQYTQPAILTVSIGIHRLLATYGIEPDIVAGLSLGEYSALVASGALTFESALSLVCKRGKYMSEAAPKGSGKMVAVLNTDRSLIEQICQEVSQAGGIVSPANYNTQKQIVIGGEVDAVNQACEKLTARGVKRMLPLKVSGPFHTALLKPAAIKLANTLKNIQFKPMKLPLISNTTADIMLDNQVKILLEQQVMSSVLWEDSIRKIKTLGVKQVIEVGPGKVLSSFIKTIDPSFEIARVSDQTTLEKTLEQVNSGR